MTPVRVVDRGVASFCAAPSAASGEEIRRQIGCRFVRQRSRVGRRHRLLDIRGELARTAGPSRREIGVRERRRFVAAAAIREMTTGTSGEVRDAAGRRSRDWGGGLRLRCGDDEGAGGEGGRCDRAGSPASQYVASSNIFMIMCMSRFGMPLGSGWSKLVFVSIVACMRLATMNPRFTL